MIKHNFPFIPPHCGVHIAQSRGTFPDHPAQTLFDLLNRRDFVLFLHLSEPPQKALSLNMRWHLHYSDITLSPCTKRRRRKEPAFVPSEKRCMPSLDNAVLATSIRFLSYLPCSECSCVLSVFLLYFETIGGSDSLRWATTKLPTNRRKTGFAGSCIIS